MFSICFIFYNKIFLFKFTKTDQLTFYSETHRRRLPTLIEFCWNQHIQYFLNLKLKTRLVTTTDDSWGEFAKNILWGTSEKQKWAVIDWRLASAEKRFFSLRQSKPIEPLKRLSGKKQLRKIKRKLHKCCWWQWKEKNQPSASFELSDNEAKFLFFFPNFFLSVCKYAA